VAQLPLLILRYQDQNNATLLSAVGGVMLLVIPLPFENYRIDSIRLFERIAAV
jgi:hypothetical protein